MRDVDALQGRAGPLPADVRCVRTALDGLDMPALTPAARTQLAELLAVAQQALRGDPRSWRRSEARACPRVVAGLECQSPSPLWGPGAPCICKRFASLLDHRATWEVDGSLVLTAEKYEVDGAALAAFIFECAGLGLDVRISGAGRHYPGATFRILFRPRPALVEDV